MGRLSAEALKIEADKYLTERMGAREIAVAGMGGDSRDMILLAMVGFACGITIREIQTVITGER